MNRATAIGIVIFCFVIASGSLSVSFAQGKYSAFQKDSIRTIELIDSLYGRIYPSKQLDPLAIVCPSDVYGLGGQVAVSAINQIDRNREFYTIFILLNNPDSKDFGYQVCSARGICTPLDTVDVNWVLAEKMAKHHKLVSCFTDSTILGDDFIRLLTLLQYHLAKPFRVLPIVSNKPSSVAAKELGTMLKSFLKPKNLFVVSTNFSEGMMFEEATYIDKVMLLSILDNSPSGFLRSYRNFKKNDQFAGLRTIAEGWNNILCLLYMTADNEEMNYWPVLYQNHEPVSKSKNNWVVGYHALGLSKFDKTPQLELSREEMKVLINVARQTIKDFVLFNIVKPLDSTSQPEVLQQYAASFVNIKKHGKMRSQGGSFDESRNLLGAVQQATVEACSNRKSVQISRAELGQLEIEVVVPTQLKQIKSIHEIQLGVHGIYIEKGIYSGYFLPEEATYRGWNVPEFLSQCAQFRVGIGRNDWHDADIYIFETTRVSESVLFDVY